MFLSNIFTAEDLADIQNDLDQQLQTQDWLDWALIKNVSYPKEQGSITFKFVSLDIKNILRKTIVGIDPATRGYDFQAYYQVWDIGAATGLHTDSQYMFNATFYLNKDWHVDKGGLYVYQRDNQYYAYVPQYNSCTYINQYTLEPHLVTPVTIYANEKRYTIHCKGLQIHNQVIK